MSGTVALGKLLFGARRPGTQAAGEALQLPATPAITVVEPVTNPPAFDIDLPSGNADAPIFKPWWDAAVGDTLRIQITLATDTGFAAVVLEVTHTLDADDLASNPIEVAGLDVLDADDYIARARLERPDVGNSAWSATTASFEVPAAVTKSYTFRSIQTYTGSNTAGTFSVDIGDEAADRVVIINAQSQNVRTVSGVTVNGTSLGQDVADTVAGGSSEMWSGVVPTGAGTVSVVVTWVNGAYLARSISAWTATGLDSTSPQDTALGETDTLSVAAGDFLFAGAMNPTSTPPSMAGFTQAPAENTAVSGSFAFTAGDLTVVSTNASFSVALTAGAATFVTFR